MNEETVMEEMPLVPNAFGYSQPGTSLFLPSPENEPANLESNFASSYKTSTPDKFRRMRTILTGASILSQRLHSGKASTG